MKHKYQSQEHFDNIAFLQAVTGNDEPKSVTDEVAEGMWRVIGELALMALVIGLLEKFC
jgi:hypothetical protein